MNLQPVPATAATLLPLTPPALATDISLSALPPEATLQIFVKPSSGALPIDGRSFPARELLPNTGNIILVCFARTNPSNWEQIKRELTRAENLGVPTLMVGCGSSEEIASALWGAGAVAGRHSLSGLGTHQVLFKPNRTLIQALDISQPMQVDRVRNAILVVRDGRIIKTWISEGDGTKPHDWTVAISLID